MAGAVPASPRIQFPSSSGGLLPAGMVDVYLAGTTTRTNTWQDKALTVLNTNPIILDVAGSCLLLTDPSQSYKFVVSDVNGAVQYTVDNIMGVGTFPTVAQFVNDKFSGNGSQTTFSLSVTPTGKNNTEVFIAGIYQPKAAYSLVGNAITFVSAPASGTNNIEVNTLNVTDYAAVSANITAQVAAAAASAASAAHIYASTYAVAPVTRPDGSAIQAGDIYFGTDGYEYAYIGGAWVNQTSASAASAAAALVSQNAASTSATSAAGSASASAASATTAGNYAAAAATGAQFFDTIALGAAGVSTGLTFGVKAGGTDGLARPTVYKNVDGTAANALPLYGLVTGAEFDAGGATIGVSTTALTPTITGSSTPNTSSTATTFLWSAMAASASDLLLTQVSVRVAATGTGKIIVVDRYNNVIADVPVTTSVAGVNTFNVAPTIVPIGGRVFWETLTGGALRFIASGTSFSIAAASYSGSVGANVGAATTQSSVGVAMACTFYAISLPHDAAITANKNAQAYTSESAGTVNKGGMTTYTSALAQSGTWTIGSPSIQKFEMAVDGGTDLIVGTVVSAITADLIAATGTDHFRVRVFKRATANGDVTAVVGVDEVVSDVTRTVAQLGLTLDASTTASVQVPVVPFTVEAGKTYHIITEALTSANALQTFGVGNASATEARVRRRGWFTNSATQTAVAAGSQSTIGFTAALQYTQARVFDRIIRADATISSMTVSLLGLFERLGIARTFATSQTIAAATNVRYDTIYYDQEAGTFGVVQGTDRANDPSEFIPALGDPKRVQVCNVRATASAVTVTPNWNVFNAETRTLEQELEAERRRGRLCIQKVTGKLRRGAAVKMLSFGDSIVAIANTTGQSLSVPDGLTRDLPAYYLNNIGSDLVSTYPLVSNLSLGRADDGGGNIHITQGFVWELYRAMQKSGSSVVYNNFGVAGTTSADAANPTPSAWLTAAVALAPDVVVVNFGMNEIGNTGTEARMVTILNTFLAAGIEVIVMGCVRPRSGATQANWEYTNRAVYRAAMYTGCAFVPVLPLYELSYLGAMGMTLADICSSNTINHPGFREHQTIGKALAKLVMGDA